VKAKALFHNLVYFGLVRGMRKHKKKGNRKNCIQPPLWLDLSEVHNEERRKTYTSFETYPNREAI
jgi:hypothetical protein